VLLATHRSTPSRLNGHSAKIDAVLTNTVKAPAADVRLSTLRYIDVDVQGQQCKGLVDSGAEVCLLSEELAREINVDECGYINVRGIFSDPIRLTQYAYHLLV